MIIYISYDSINYDVAQALAVQLGILGHDVEFERKVIGGHVGWHQVFAGIENCDVFVFCVTNRTIRLYAERLEYDYACALCKPILPVWLEDMSLESLPLELSDFPCVGYPPGEDVKALLSSALAYLQPIQMTANLLPLRPDLRTPLTKLRDKVVNLPADPSAQYVIYYNLRQFLERYETFYDTRNILRCLQSHPRASKAVVYEVRKTFKEIRGLRTRRIVSRRSRQVLRDIVLVIAVPICLLILMKGFQAIPSMLHSTVSTSAEPTQVSANAQNIDNVTGETIQYTITPILTPAPSSTAISVYSLYLFSPSAVNPGRPTFLIHRSKTRMPD